ncbi:M23 family metallopeptidase [Candidatus Woesearchaeota archaeon]|nr:M23 family metallopeptidase [Candidatus Woesearchaeota archaeon]
MIVKMLAGRVSGRGIVTGKRGTVVYPITILFIMIIFVVYTGISLNLKYKALTRDRFLGEKQMGLLSMYAEGEDILFYVDSSASLSAEKSVYDLGQYGGIYSQDCGSSYQYSIWDEGCRPQDHLARSYSRIFNRNMDYYMLSFPGGVLPVDSYDVLLKQLGSLGVLGFSSRLIGVGLWDSAGAGSLEHPPLQELIVTSEFGRPRQRYDSQGRPYTGRHEGIDFRAAVGTPVFAVADGQIVDMGCRGAAGDMIKMVDGNGVLYFYAHLSRYAPGIAVGKSVRASDIIGYTGLTAGCRDGCRLPSACGLPKGQPHLHFGVHVNGEWINPRQVLGLDSSAQSSSASSSFSSFAQYSVKPNFRTEVDYDLGVYEKVYASLGKFRECMDEDDVKACAEEKIEALNSFSPEGLTWELDCSKNIRKAYFDIVEKHSLCRSSFNDNCTCEFELDYRDDFAGDKDWPMVIIVNRTADDGTEYFIDGLKDYSYVSAPNISLNFFYAGNYFSTPNATLSFVFSRYGLLKGGSFTISAGDSSFGSDKLYLFRKDGLLYYTDAAGFASLNLPQCEYQNRTIRVCAVQDKSFRVFDDFENSTAGRNVTIRFALDILDNSTPSAFDFWVFDLPKASSSVVVQWNKSASSDVKFYGVHHYPSRIDDVYSMWFSDVDPNRPDFILNDIDFASQTQSGGKTLYLVRNPGEDYMDIQRGKLYYLLDRKQFVYILDSLEDSDDPASSMFDKDYYFYVGAKDFSGNVLDNGPPKPGRSIDDELSP